MSFDFTKIKDTTTASELLQASVKALETISKLTENATDDRAAVIMRAVVAVIETVKAGFAGTVTPEQVQRELAKMTDRLAANDAVADRALADRFPSETD